MRLRRSGTGDGRLSFGRPLQSFGDASVSNAHHTHEWRIPVRHGLLWSLGGLVLAIVVVAGQTFAADEKPKYTIKEVMKEHKKGALRDKVLEGKASKEEKTKLVDLYKALGANKPPKGDEDNWKKLTKAIVKAAEDVVADKEGGIDALKKALDCTTCHKDHKPS